MADDVPPITQETIKQGQFGNLTSNEKSAFDAFKEQCTTKGFLAESICENEDDLSEGICDDGTLL